MPHGISGFQARRLVKSIDRYWTAYLREHDRLPAEEKAAAANQTPGMTFYEVTDLQAYLLGKINDSAVPFGGRAFTPSAESVIAAAEALGRAMNNQTLIDLAANVRSEGL